MKIMPSKAGGKNGSVCHEIWKIQECKRNKKEPLVSHSCSSKFGSPFFHHLCPKPSKPSENQGRRGKNGEKTLNGREALHRRIWRTSETGEDDVQESSKSYVIKCGVNPIGGQGHSGISMALNESHSQSVGHYSNRGYLNGKSCRGEFQKMTSNSARDYVVLEDDSFLMTWFGQ